MFELRTARVTVGTKLTVTELLQSCGPTVRLPVAVRVTFAFLLPGSVYVGAYVALALGPWEEGVPVVLDHV